MTTKCIGARPEALTDAQFSYCPGCGHGIIHRLIAETIDELGIRERTVVVASIGCSGMCIDYFNVDAHGALHGRAPAVATGIKRVSPDSIVFTLQGDGDLASIGTAEAFHVALRGENITTVFVNNAIYGMTGGQMAATTLLAQKTKTTPLGRVPAREGYPMPVSELMAAMPGTRYVARVSIHSPKHVVQAKRAILKAFSNQVEKKGFSLVEILSSCPTNWGLSPVDSMRWIEETMVKTFPLGEFKNV